jgi:hypothetical protein
MGAEVRIMKGSDLSRINEVIHDYWFDLDDVTFDEAASMLVIRFSRPLVKTDAPASGWSLLRRVEVPYVESFLRLHHVRGWALEDTERIGSYDFNELRFDEGKQRIQITTGVPLNLSADVERLEVSVLVTDNVVKTEKRLAFFV